MNIPSKVLARLALALSVTIVPSASAGTVQILVTPAVAPNETSASAGWSSWLANYYAAVQAGQSSAGTPGTPGYYTAAASAISETDVQVTSFNSWLGFADPGNTYGSAFAGEYGNRLVFGVDIKGNGNKISISDLSFNAVSTDTGDGTPANPGNALGIPGFGAGSYNYNADYEGIIYGAGPNGSNEIITSGPNTQLVDDIVGRGSGNAYWPCAPGDPTPCSTTAQQQGALNDSASYNGTPYNYTGTYTLTSGGVTVATGSGTVEIDPIPEPSTWLMLGSGLMAVALFARRRQSA